MPTLILSMDGLVLREVQLKEGRTRIGRAGDNTLQLDNPAVSQHHAAITVVGGDAFLEDCDSTNGTQLNQGNVRRAVLRNNDLITIGKYQLRYLSADPPDTLAPREPPINPAATIHEKEPQPLPPAGSYEESHYLWDLRPAPLRAHTSPGTCKGTRRLPHRGCYER